MGLPLLNGFVGEFTILQGAFVENWKWAALAVPGVILGAAYLLWLYQRTFLGRSPIRKNEKLHDLTLREIRDLRAADRLALWIGLYPEAVLRDSGAAGEPDRARACGPKATRNSKRGAAKLGPPARRQQTAGADAGCDERERTKCTGSIGTILHRH